MLSKIKILLTLLSLSLMSACASGPQFEKVENVAGKALIYIYRPSTIHGSGFSPEIKINDQSILHLVSGGYFPYFSSPGEITISITNVGTKTITLKATSGQTYYVRGGTIPMALGIPSIKLMPTDIGSQEINKCKLIPRS